MQDPQRLRAALYARVSTDTQTTENQILELRQYATRQGWTAAEYLDPAISGSKESRPANVSPETVNRLRRELRQADQQPSPADNTEGAL